MKFLTVSFQIQNLPNFRISTIMLKGSFFTIENSITKENVHSFEVKLNKNHHIFEGHFPSQPIAPGVCLAQMVKELAETQLNEKLKMVSARNMKFMAILNPTENEKVTVEVKISPNESFFDVRASCFTEEKVFFKIDATYIL